jgi:hypothetical protein
VPKEQNRYQKAIPWLVGSGLLGMTIFGSWLGYENFHALGERQHTTYMAAAPEHGRETFFLRMQREVEQVKRLYPHAHYQGLADGAPENWTCLVPLTHSQVLDFYHATQYLSKVALAVHPRSVEYQQASMDTHCHLLKHSVGAATRLLAEMEAIEPQRLSIAGSSELSLSTVSAKSSSPPSYTQRYVIIDPIHVLTYRCFCGS